MLVIKQRKLPVWKTKDDLKSATENALREVLKKNITIDHFEIRRQSLDARKRNNDQSLSYVYEVGVTLKGYTSLQLISIAEKCKKRMDISFEEPQKEYDFVSNANALNNKKASLTRPIVVGLGPAGLFAAYLLSMAGLKPIVIERGECIENRVKTVEDFWNGKEKLKDNSNVQFGEGGAGTFSDGKLNTLVKNAKDHQHFVLETFVKHGANEDILYAAKPHIGTDLLRTVVISMREKILSLGGEIHYETRLTDLLIEDNKLKGVVTTNGTFATNACFLCIGHSARDTFLMLKNKNIQMEQKPFAVGVRVIHDQHMIDENQYGMDYPDCMPPASYKLTAHTKNERSVYSFCMCPGGYVVNASSEQGKIAINGMSYHLRDSKCANSAIVVNVTPNDFPNADVLSGVEFQRYLEESAFKLGDGMIPVQDMQSFLENKAVTPKIEPKIMGAYRFSDLKKCLPEFIYEALTEGLKFFDTKIHGFAGDNAYVCAIESRTSSPVRIIRDESLQSIKDCKAGHIKGLFPCGEGAGYAGGITSAAVDGIRCANKLIEDYLNVI